MRMKSNEVLACCVIALGVCGVVAGSLLTEPTAPVPAPPPPRPRAPPPPPPPRPPPPPPPPGGGGGGGEEHMGYAG